MKRGSYIVLHVLLAAITTAACTTSRTEVLVSIATDLAIPAELDQIRVRVSSESGEERFSKTYDAIRAVLPLSLGLVPGGDKAVAFRVVVDGLSGGEVVVSRSALTSFVPSQSLLLYVDLLRLCRRVSCSAGQTCSVDGTCGPDRVDPKTLPKVGTSRDASAGETVPDAAPSESGVDKGSEPPPSETGGETAPGDKPAEPMSDPTLRASYAFDEGTGSVVKDDSMYANDGVSTAVWVPGMSAGYALRFETVSTKVTAPDSPSLSVTGTELTVEAWVKASMSWGAGGNQSIINKGGAGGGYWFFVGTPGNQLCLNTGVKQVCTLVTTFSVGVWRHVAAVLGSGSVRLYADGHESGSQADPDVLTATTDGLTIGHPGFGKGLLGDIDLPQIWSRARTSEEICGDAGRKWSAGACM